MNQQSNREDQIRERLLARRETLLDRERRVSRDLTRFNDPLVADFSDQAIQVQNDEALHVIARAAELEVREIDTALERLQGGVYGICKHCGKPIAPKRLAAMPQATSCASCP